MNRRFALIQALVSLVALAAVVWWASQQDAPTFPTRARPATRGSCAALLLYAVATLMRAERWHRILRLTGVRRLANRLATRSPRRLHGQQRAARARRRGAQRRAARRGARDASKRTLLGSVVAERMLDLIALAAIFVVVVYGVLSSSVLPTDRPVIVAGSRRGCCWWSRRSRSGSCAATTSSSARATGCARWPTHRARCSDAAGRCPAGRHVRAVGGRGGRVPGRGPRGRPRLQRDAARSTWSRSRTSSRRCPPLPARSAPSTPPWRSAPRRLGASGSMAVSYMLLLRFVLYMPITVVGLVDPGHSLRRLVAPALGHPARVERRGRGRGPNATPRPRGHGHAPSHPDAGARRTAASAAPAGLGPRPPAADAGDGRPALVRELIRWGGSMPVLIAVCLVVAALTPGLLPSTPTYDPWAWILWGREIAHLDLVTEGGPSWKPLPMLFTTPFSVFGDDVAPYLWLIVARAGGLLACVMTFRVARRLIGGGWYGVLAGDLRRAGAVLELQVRARRGARATRRRCSRRSCSGPSSATLTGAATTLSTWPSRPRCCAPRSWPFLGLYGLWLWFARAVSCACASWCWRRSCPRSGSCPSGGARATPSGPARRANNPNPGSAAFAEHPALELISRFRKVVIAPVKLGIIIGFVYALCMWVRHRREGLTLAVAAGSLRLVRARGRDDRGRVRRQPALPDRDHRGACACSADGRRAGAPGRGLARRARVHGRARRRAHRGGGLLRLAGDLLTVHRREGRQHRKGVRGASPRGPAVARPEGPDRRRRAGATASWPAAGVFSGPFQTQMVAYQLHVHGIQVGSVVTPAPGAVFRTRTVPDGPLVVKPTDDRFRLVATKGKWRLLTAPQVPGGAACPRAGPDAPTAPPPPA